MATIEENFDPRLSPEQVEMARQLSRMMIGAFERGIADYQADHDCDRDTAILAFLARELRIQFTGSSGQLYELEPGPPHTADSLYSINLVRLAGPEGMPYSGQKGAERWQN